MPSNEILEQILKELRLVQERAERLRVQAQDKGSDNTSTREVSAHIEDAVRNIHQLICDFEQIEREKSA
jgi:hypothetical protein